ncbi:MAG: glycosyltransferase [Polyangiaceae bacterium]|nr:glycosyltransferase [Polyangiaceae bacterium]
MRLLFVAPNILVPGTNGGSTHVTEVVHGLRKQHDVLLAARYRSHGHQTLASGAGTAGHPGTYPLAAYHAARIYPHARKFRPQAIYERFSAQGAGIMLGRALRIPVISMVLDNHATTLTLAGANKLITTAPHLVPKRYHPKCVRVSWGANVERFHPDIDAGSLRKELGYGADDFILAYTGAFYEWHGLDILMQAVAKLKADGNIGKLKVLLVGEGHVREEIQQLARELGVADRVRFHDRVPYEQIPRFLAISNACTAVYDPPRNPNLAKHGMYFDPLKVFEYLACGKPALVMNTGNMRDIFTPDEHAMLVETASTDALAAALNRVMTDTELRAQLSTAGRELVVRKYSWQSHADHLGELFGELVDRNGETAP